MENRVCFVCNEKMNKTETSIEAGWGKYKLTISGIEAFQCPKCGEKIFSMSEMKMIQELGKNLSYLSPDDERPVLLNLSQTADLLRVSNQTIYNMIRDGRLKAVKLGREWKFNRKDIESIMSGEVALIAVNNNENKTDDTNKKHLATMG